MAITRFAPSPTGYLHIGGLRTALYNYLWAKKTHGQFKIRIEDTDSQRNNTEAMMAIIKAFNWVGINSDDEVEYQSKRKDIYKQYLNQLLDNGKAYKCYMSKNELENLRKEQEENKQTPMYNGKYREYNGTIPKGVEPVIRIKSPQEGEIKFVDGIKGKMVIKSNQIDDFIIARSNGMATYNFVVAIDDYLMKISDIIRGDDHLTNTAKQLIIYKALNFKIPNFFHIPMINNPQGKKLSKRDGAMDVMDYKTKGYLPQALLNFLVRLGWSNKDQEIFSMDEMIKLFDPNNINKSSSSYNEKKLLWINSQYIKKTDNTTLINLLKGFDCDIENINNKNNIIDVCKLRANTLIELKHEIINILNVPRKYEAKGVKKFIKDDTLKIIKNYKKILMENQTTIEVAKDIENITKPFIEKNNLTFSQLFQPIRIAITGGTQAPSVYDIIVLLGIQESMSRIDKAIQNNFNL